MIIFVTIKDVYFFNPRNDYKMNKNFGRLAETIEKILQQLQKVLEIFEIFKKN